MAKRLKYIDLKNSLDQFYGTEHYYKVGLTPIVATEGVKYFADTCECYWLLDEICYGLYKPHQQLGALFLDIEAKKSHSIHIIARQDEGMPIVFEKKVHDICRLIPVGSYKIWLMDNVLLLPSEY